MPLDEFAAFNHEDNADECLEIEENGTIRLTDEQAKIIIELYSGCRNLAEFQALQKAEQEKYIGTFKEKGLSIRQIVRLAGISKGLVENG